MDCSEEKLISIVNKTLDDLYINDKYLLEKDASERNIVFHFGRYFINNLKESMDFKDYNVDYEYNRDVFNEREYKEIIYENKQQRIFPDIILHKRGTNEENILAIEFKKRTNTNERKGDYFKLRALTDSKYKFKYSMGLFIDLGKVRKNVLIKKFVDGKTCK